MNAIARSIAIGQDAETAAGANSACALEVQRVPRITIDAFCDGQQTMADIEAALSDRRMARARWSLSAGGIEAAIDRFGTASTPNLLIVEAARDGDALLGRLGALADVCDADTKVIVIGYANDICLYRELREHGVAEYILAPIDPMALIVSICRLYDAPGATKLGRTCAFIGAKGGVGSSTIAQNVAWTLAERQDLDTMLADMDLSFGSAGVNFDIDPGRGIIDAIQGSDRLDTLLVERLVINRGERLSLLAARGDLGSPRDLGSDAFDKLLEAAQSAFPMLVLDVPHLWTDWVRQTLSAADDVIITAAPDLANLSNAKRLIDELRKTRPNDAPPRLVLNQVAMPRRAEIAPDDFAAALELSPAACLSFDPAVFSAAANKGRMVGEAAPRAAACRAFDVLAETLSGRAGARRRRGAGWRLSRLWGR